MMLKDTVKVKNYKTQRSTTKDLTELSFVGYDIEKLY